MTTGVKEGMDKELKRLIDFCEAEFRRLEKVLETELKKGLDKAKNP